MFKNNDGDLIKFNTDTVYGAVGGGKENLLNDPDFNKILNKEYHINVINDTWSNGKTIKDPVLRSDGSGYDYIFFSDMIFAFCSPRIFLTFSTTFLVASSSNVGLITNISS